jgi:phosphatidylserine/phosphatidylglycerophosphate/cardiolipin synthase-like enzyme
VFVRAIDRADTEIHVNVYEFSSAGITESLTNAAGRGVNVTVLLEGGPVGGISAEERAAVFRLHVKGIPVFVMRTTEKGHAPYRYNHAKYIVVDGRGVLITSENFKESGIPQPGRSGNRGWGAYIENKGFARYMDAVFETDLHANFIAPFQGTEGPPEEVSDVSYTPEFPAREFSGTRVTPVLAPDTSSLILDLINGAEQDIAIEQAYITNESGTTLNPYLSAAINASRRGVHVRVLLDSYWFNVEEGADNDEMVRCINQIAAREHLPLTARLIDLPASSFAKIHNKGVIVDHQRVLVSSINWNSNSPGFNREAGVII